MAQVVSRAPFCAEPLRAQAMASALDDPRAAKLLRAGPDAPGLAALREAPRNLGNNDRKHNVTMHFHRVI